MMQPQSERRPSESAGQSFFGGMLGDLREQLSGLVRAEIRLARTEMTRNVREMGKEAALVGAGGALAYAGLLALMASVISLFARILPRWLSALIVGLAMIGGGAALARKGQEKMRAQDVLPEQTIDSVKETATRVKQQLS